MAIFRAETKSLSRGKSHNLVAAISYRAGIKLTDNNTINPKARSYDYTKKTDVVHSEILLPKNLSEQLDESDIELDFQRIADLVEIGETTKRGKMKSSARLAREWVLCGVPELTRAENIELFEQFAQQQSEEQGVLSMVFVHDPTAGDDMATTKAAAEGKSMAAPDPRNIHAHILLLTRKLDVSSDSLLSLGEKSDSELSNDERTRPVVPKKLVGTIDPETGKKIQQGRGLCSNSEWLKNTRKQWADILNERLEQKGIQPVTHKSYKDLGLTFKPTKHLGKNASIAERMGVQTEIGKYNESVNRYNHNQLEQTANSGITSSQQQIARSQRWIDAISTGDAYIQRQIEQETQQEKHVNSRIGQGVRRRAERQRPNPYEQQLKTSADNRKQRATELRERTIIFDRASERADRNARYRKPRINGVIGEVDRLTMKTALLFSSRRNESSSYTDRQKDILEQFANENSLVTGDFREDIRVTTTFFSDADNAQTHKHIVKLINDPEREEQNHSKTSKFEAESDLNKSTRDYVDNESKTSNTADLSVSIAPRRYRRP
ncbi:MULTISPECIES: MobA/MobL family protein [unclassified Psychrobacter]|uniref:MobA/MobL family protein n=5 Tax=Psychrobacter TaxID=497 RepID=UPI0017885442|nr:MobA/MobL family protein [Psychrobacter sp. FME6]MBE0407946.1 MobA/MobL family protein [Psychrobacter sp. FME6]